MTDNVQPSALGGLQIRCMGLKSVGDQRKQGNPANKPSKKKRKKKQNDEMNPQNDTAEDATPFEENVADKDELPKNGSGSIIDLEI